MGKVSCEKFVNWRLMLEWMLQKWVLNIDSVLCGSDRLL